MLWYRLLIISYRNRINLFFSFTGIVSYRLSFDIHHYNVFFVFVPRIAAAGREVGRPTGRATSPLRHPTPTNSTTKKQGQRSRGLPAPPPVPYPRKNYFKVCNTPFPAPCKLHSSMQYTVRQPPYTALLSIETFSVHLPLARLTNSAQGE